MHSFCSFIYFLWLWSGHLGLFVIGVGTGSFNCWVTRACLWYVLEQVPSTHRLPGLICDVCWKRFLRLSGHQGLFVIGIETGSFNCWVTRAYFWCVLEQVPSSHRSPGFICDVCWNRLLRLSGHQILFVMCVGTGSFYPQVSRAYLWHVLEQAPLTRSPWLICDVCWNRFLWLSGHQGLLILWYVLEQVPSTLRSPGLVNFVMGAGTGSSDCQVTRAFLWCVLEQVPVSMTVRSPGLICDVSWNRFTLVTRAY